MFYILFVHILGISSEVTTRQDDGDKDDKEEEELEEEDAEVYENERD